MAVRRIVGTRPTKATFGNEVNGYVVAARRGVEELVLHPNPIGLFMVRPRVDPSDVVQEALADAARKLAGYLEQR